MLSLFCCSVKPYPQSCRPEDEACLKNGALLLLGQGGENVVQVSNFTAAKDPLIMIFLPPYFGLTEERKMFCGIFLSLSHPYSHPSAPARSFKLRFRSKYFCSSSPQSSTVKSWFVLTHSKPLVLFLAPEEWFKVHHLSSETLLNY